MAKDYAKHKTTKKKQPRKLGRFLFLMVLVIIGGYFVGSFFNFDSVKQSIKTNWTKVTVKSKQITQKATPKKQELPKPKFEFYTILPKDRASNDSPSIENQERLNNPKNIALEQNTQQYLLQVASFKRASDADKLKAELILKGYEVKLTEFKQGKTTWYRVNVGPFRSKDIAFKTQVKLHQYNDRFIGIIRRIA